MKLFYMVYFAGIALFILNSVSAALFAKARWQKKLTRVVSAVAFSVAWPLSLFSAEGRKVIISRTTKI